MSVRVTVLEDAGAVARAAADRVVQQAAQGEPAFALPTGRTPVPMYDELAARFAAGSADLSRVRGFNLDELVLPHSDPRTFRSFMERHAWGRTGLRRDRCDIPDGAAADLDAECARYEAAIAAGGGLDLAVLGLGVDGHVAYNMPGVVRLPTHVTRLPDGLAAALEVPESEWPLRALTMGLGTIRAARRILVLATGEPKATAVRMLVHGPEDPQWPCSFLRDHGDIELLADPGAARQLRGHGRQDDGPRRAGPRRREPSTETY
jgi:glucosamine-6-phosphate deaminase